MKTLGLCMALKNEGTTIYRALESCHSVIDEFIIGIDKTTKDNTKEEVQKFFKDFKIPQEKINLYDFDWKDSFSEARNEGIRKCKSDFFLILDGHEFFPESWLNITENARTKPRQHLGQLKEILGKEDTDEYYFHLYQQPFVSEIPNNFFLQPRIYRNGPSKLKGHEGKPIDFGRAAHNAIRFTRPELFIPCPQIIIIHDAPEENRKERNIQRVEMNTRELREDLKKKPDDLRALFYLGNTRLEGRDFKEAEECFDKYHSLTKVKNSETYQAYINLSLTCKELGKKDKQIDSILNAVKVDPHRRDGFLLAGDFYMKGEDYEKAAFYYNTCMTINANPSRMFQNGLSSTVLPHVNIAKAYEKMGKKESAIAHYKQALKFLNNEEWHEAIKKISGNTENIYIVDRVGSFTKPFIDFLKKKEYNVVVTKHVDNVLATWADKIWCEWADENAVQLSAHKEKLVIRVHGYEAYANKHMFKSIPWDCKQVVFVANHIKESVAKSVPSLNGQAKLISNGVDTNKFFIKNTKRDPRNVGIAGFMSSKKNPMRLASIIKKLPDAVFNLRIDWQDPFLKEAFDHETRKCKNIVYHGRYDDLNDFWNQMSFAISTSDIESFSFNIAEAMACGCQPYVYNWKGAEEIWREKDIFTEDEIPTFENAPTEEEMKVNRDFIATNYPEDRSLISMAEALLS